ncbi:hypothetical protein M3O96_10605 [Aquiflexum sp. TKW24L]|uniref:hypothetical protein n=1 Tax=Aquiflexum sp. TKW24L TaxID=2942212 RepID=UPI0020BFBAA8|nr:hypothetical protein [Aquiflexum sp. TKW24L]MCL6259542.1 hypothetical protein [Aquiflexum sp. TKW24L]
MSQLLNSIGIIVKKSLKTIEPALMLFSGTYLLTQSIQQKNFPLGVAGGFLLFRGGMELGKAIEESELKTELNIIAPEEIKKLH